jgi:membrane protein implicated in regulation of membrane protease activity
MTSSRYVFERFRAAFWILTAAIVGMYFYGLALGIYAPLELGLISFACLALLVAFTVHEVLLRRELRDHPREVDHTDKERRGF